MEPFEIKSEFPELKRKFHDFDQLEEKPFTSAYGVKTWPNLTRSEAAPHVAPIIINSFSYGATTFSNKNEKIQSEEPPIQLMRNSSPMLKSYLEFSASSNVSHQQDLGTVHKNVESISSTTSQPARLSTNSQPSHRSPISQPSHQSTTFQSVYQSTAFQPVHQIATFQPSDLSTNFQPAYQSATSHPVNQSTTSQPLHQSTTSQARYQSTTFQPVHQSTTFQPAHQSTTSQPLHQRTTSQARYQNSTFHPVHQSTTFQSSDQSTNFQPAHQSAASHPVNQSTTFQPAHKSATSHPVNQSTTTQPVNLSTTSKSAESSNAKLLLPDSNKGLDISLDKNGTYDRENTHDEIFKCSQCRYTTFRSYCMEHHVQDVHTRDQAIIYNLNEPKRPRYLPKDDPEFIKKNPFTCEKCEYRTNRPYQIAKHMKVHNRDHPCPHCNNDNPKITRLNHPQVGVRLFCPKCEYKADIFD